MNAVAPMRAVRAAESERAGLAAFVVDEETREMLAGVLGLDWPGASIMLATVEDAVEHLSSDPSPRYLVIDLSGQADPLGALDRLAEVCAPGTGVVALGSVNDVGFYRTLRAAGVADYLVKPVAPEALAAALHALKRRHAAPEPEKPVEATASRVLAVIGSRGGVGATTIATSLAWLAAHEQRRRTMLVDFDLHCGAAALALDIEPGHGLWEALESPSRVDSLFVASAAAPLGDNFYLLCSEEPLDAIAAVRSDAVERLAVELRRDFERIVIDLPRNNPDLLRQGLAQAEDVVIVTDLSLVGLRDANRLVALAKSTAPSAKIRVLANRVGAAKKGEVPRAEAEKAIGMPFTACLPDEGGVPMAAANTGQPLPKAQPRSKVVAGLRALAASLGAPASGKPAGLIARLLAGVKAAA